LATGEQKSHVDWHACEDCLFDCRETFAGAWDLDEEILAFRAGVESLGRGEGAGRIASRQG
jgi:hypothetical protein